MFSPLKSINLYHMQTTMVLRSIEQSASVKLPSRHDQAEQPVNVETELLHKLQTVSWILRFYDFHSFVFSLPLRHTIPDLLLFLPLAQETNAALQIKHSISYLLLLKTSPVLHCSIGAVFSLALQRTPQTLAESSVHPAFGVKAPLVFCPTLGFACRPKR
ncbi:hypothetical protein XENOCAPTIV_006963 [Xenoophorus captivus]|uniref:Uncharacterized protein n=1 Tax=Xenoophorus captivus TaxID=1517983 RepID=A0ABV0R7F1_9TELE